MIDLEKPKKNRKEGFAFDSFNTLENIYWFLDDIEKAHPGRAKIINIGESYEGRPLTLIKITNDDNNPAVFIEANIHASLIEFQKLLSF